MTIKPYLEAARNIILDPEHWTQGEHAIANTGQSVTIDDPEAYAFCADGALLKAILDLGRPDPAYSPEYLACSTKLNSVSRQLWDMSLVELNDCDDTHADIIAVFNAAIQSVSIPGRA